MSTKCVLVHGPYAGHQGYAIDALKPANKYTPKHTGDVIGEITL